MGSLRMVLVMEVKMVKMIETEMEGVWINDLWLRVEVKVMVGDPREELLEENAELVSKYDLDLAQQLLP